MFTAIYFDDDVTTDIEAGLVGPRLFFSECEAVAFVFDYVVGRISNEWEGEAIYEFLAENGFGEIEVEDDGVTPVNEFTVERLTAALGVLGTFVRKEVCIQYFDNQKSEGKQAFFTVTRHHLREADGETETIEFQADDMNVTQTIEIIEPEYTKERIVSELKSGALLSTLEYEREPSCIREAGGGHPVARILSQELAAGNMSGFR